VTDRGRSPADDPGRPRVCVVGSLHFDVMVRAPYLPRTGETLIGEAWWWKPGGKGGNQAMAAARHGADVELVGCLGDDDLGARLRECLVAAGVGLGHVRTVAQGSGMSVAIEVASGDYAAIVVSGANRELDEAQAAGSADVISGSQVLLLQHEIAEGANAAAARLAREVGVRVVLNAAPARPLASLDGLVDVLVVNGVEAEMLGSQPVTDLSSAAAAARELRRLAPAVIVTASAAGVAMASADEEATVPGHAVGRAESHGAGDAFVGALAARLAGGSGLAGSSSLLEALGYANAAAALHVGSPVGDRGAIGPADVARLLARERGTPAG
jgi:ribokinase